MDLQAIARCAGVPLRQLRYVVDQQFLPRLPRRLQTHRAGQPRDFGAAEAFLAACAAALLCGGARRQTVIAVLKRLSQAPCPDEWVRLKACSTRQQAAGLPATALDALWRW